MDPNASFMLAAQRRAMSPRARSSVANMGPNGGVFSAVTLLVGGCCAAGRGPCPGLAPSGILHHKHMCGSQPPSRHLTSRNTRPRPPPRSQVFKVCNNASGCPVDTIAPPDENPDPPPVVPPMNPPSGAAWYNGTVPLPLQSAAADRPYDCSGWLGQRVYLEGQTWHTQPGLDPATGSAQMHVGACLPHRQMVAGDVPLDILLQVGRRGMEGGKGGCKGVARGLQEGCKGVKEGDPGACDACDGGGRLQRAGRAMPPGRGEAR